ncbi:MAG: glycosyltransferase, partial [candidate division WOR-3 bacterium]
MKKFLIVSYYFPPYGPPVGYLRIYKIAKLLKDKGNDVLIFSNKGEEKIETNLGKEFNVIWIENEPISKEIKDKFSFFKFIGWPDRRITFFFKGFKKFKNLINKYNPDYVIITSPPFSALLFSLLVPKDKLIVDFRDIWTYNDLGLINSPIQKFLSEKFEQYILKKAKKVIVLNKKAKEYLEKRYKTKNIYVLPHFWDSSIKIEQNVKKAHFLRIGHFGTIYKIQGLEKVFKSISPLFGKLNFKIYLYGFATDGTINEIIKFPFVEYKGKISFEKINDVEVDVFLVCLDRIKGYELISKNKSKELLVFKKPMLAIIPRDNVMYEEFLEIENIYLADIDDSNEIIEVFSKLYNDWENDRLLIPKNIEKYKDTNVFEKFYKELFSPLYK